MVRVIHYGLSARMGGIETYLFKLASHIDRSKIDFTFIWEGSEFPCFYQELSEMGFEFVHITSRRENFVHNQKDLNAIFANGKYDVFHCHLNTLSYITPIKIALKNNCKVVVHSRNGYADQTRFYTLWLHKLHFNWLKKQTIKRVAVSDVAAEWLFGDMPCEVINNGINIERFRWNKNKRDAVRAELEIQEKHVYGHVGSFSLQKNHDYLLEVFAEIEKEDDDAVLLLVGDGIRREHIENKIAGLGLTTKVYLMGNKKDVEKYMWAMDVFLFPSNFEGFPNVLLEAQTTGLPCVVADTITKEVRVLDSTYYLALSEDKTHWKELAIKILGMNVKREDCADMIACAGFSVSEEVNKIKKVYTV